METISINYFAVATCAVLTMVIGAVWYGPLFGRKWMEIIGVNPDDQEAKKKMQKSAGPLYLMQFVLALFQVLVLVHFIAEAGLMGGLERALWIWAAFVIPTLAGAVMWTNQSGILKWTRFFIQGGYQLVIFIAFGLILQFWR